MAVIKIRVWGWGVVMCVEMRSIPRPGTKPLEKNYLIFLLAVYTYLVSSSILRTSSFKHIASSLPNSNYQPIVSRRDRLVVVM